MPSDRLLQIRTAFFFACFGLVLSKGMAILPGYTGDDYATFYGSTSQDHFMAQGRYINAIIDWTLTGMGLRPTHVAFPAFILLCLSSAAVVAFSAVYVVPPRDAPVGSAGLAIAALLATTHPYFTEYFLFRQSLVFQFVSLSLVAVTLWGLVSLDGSERARPVWQHVAYALPLVLACALVQTSFVIVAIAVLCRIVTRLMPGSGMTVRDAAKASVPSVVLLLVAAALYSWSFVVSTRMAPALDSRASLLGADQLSDRLGQVRDLIGVLLFQSEPILSIHAKLPFLLALGVGIVGTAVACRSVRGPVLVMVAIVGTYLLSMTFVVISAAWWPAPRSLYAISLSGSLLFLLAYDHAHRVAQRLMIGLGGVAALTFSLHSAAMLRDQIRVNTWDRWAAGSIAQGLLQNGVGPDDPVLLVGAGWTHPVTPPTAYYDINVSGLFIPWALNALMMESTGRRWNISPVAAHPGCADAELWPAPGSIIIQQGPDPVLICYGR
jgi:hypothetical protein